MAVSTGRVGNLNSAAGAARPVTAAVAGSVLVVCALAAATAAAVPGPLSRGGAQRLEWNYSLALWPMLGALAVAGVLLAVRPRWARPAAVVAVILAAQAGGYGVVAVRDWFNQAGSGGGMRQSHLALVVGFAAVVALSGTLAGCVGAAVLWREPSDGWRGVRPARPAYVIGGVVVAVLVPLVIGAVFNIRTVTLIGQMALTYSLPWGGGVALAGWLGRRGRIAACATVAGSVVLVVGEVVLAEVTKFQLG